MKIRKMAALVLILAVMVLVLCGCQVRTGNRITSGLDIQTFNYAYVYVGNEKIVEGYVSQWRDYTNSDAVQVMIDGKYYLTFYSNVVLVADPKLGGLHYGSGDNN